MWTNSSKNYYYDHLQALALSDSVIFLLVLKPVDGEVVFKSFQHLTKSKLGELLSIKKGYRTTTVKLTLHITTHCFVYFLD